MARFLLASISRWITFAASSELVFGDWHGDQNEKISDSGRKSGLFGAVLRGLVNVDGTVVTFSEIRLCDDNEGGNCTALTKLDGKFSMVVILFAVGSLPTGK